MSRPCALMNMGHADVTRRAVVAVRSWLPWQPCVVAARGTSVVVSGCGSNAATNTPLTCCWMNGKAVNIHPAVAVVVNILHSMLPAATSVCVKHTLSFSKPSCPSPQPWPRPSDRKRGVQGVQRYSNLSTAWCHTAAHVSRLPF